MKRVMICDAHGGFGLSREAFLRLRELGQRDALDEPDIGEPWGEGQPVRESYGGLDSFCTGIPRTDPHLLQVFDELDQQASGRFCVLKAVEIPDDVEYQIEEYDGAEWVAEAHRTWQ